MPTVLVTGSAGFIGYFVCRTLLEEGWRVVGVDCLSNYYDVRLKQRREADLVLYSNYRSVHGMVEEPGLLFSLCEEERPDIVIHLAAQAGVRYSIDNPRAYLESNIIGTFELLEAARAFPPRHLLIASTSSAYGANGQMPYVETDRADHQMSFYAASKKSSESMAHSYAHLFNLPVTMFRFFTVYGPWGRPDMALFKFTKAILNGDPIDVYNYGDMKRDFTYVEDLVRAIRLLIDEVPVHPPSGRLHPKDSLSPVAPFRVVNIGNSDPVKLTDFISAIEAAVGRSAVKNLMPMQAGDVPATWADAVLLRSLTDYAPKTSIQEGVSKFVNWYRHYYGV
ncbi:NAD-dependent epimerase/dehydratase family protein [Sulfitobacter sp. 916]|uniref:NAD-dependent epimerase/dehydratase family protein n=1 Tax=Sulfitobacter sp. 916 TaxID=3368559 RepID=UPI003745C92A